ncbi:uncharacterized protein LOC105664906 [Ceratitis capitata]|uniref:uncharacterized protein LOC105664906 n=1 Tax=Ceratitis capitata TaxID=7213 RepID=UPI0006187F9C|nr:uncharacterized protein LOC105664906 [Ceratitis capitata]
MVNLLSHQNLCLPILLVIAAVLVLAEPVENISPNGPPKALILIERLRPPPPQVNHNSNNENMDRSGLYVMWQKVLVRVSSEFQQSVLSKSFGVMKVAKEMEETPPYRMEEIKWRNIAAEVRTDKRIIDSVLLLMKILLALDIAILLGVFLMLLGCFFKSKEPEVDEVAVKA